MLPHDRRLSQPIGWLPAVATGMFVVCLGLALLPRTPQPPPSVPFAVRWLAGELSDKYWLALVMGGLWVLWQRRPFAAPLALTMLTVQLAVEALKAAVGEMRPDGRFFNSFPSGHATASFAFATFMLALGSRWSWLWVAFAVCVGVSRVIVNAHWWHDVVGGGALGYLAAAGGYAVWRRWQARRQATTAPEPPLPAATAQGSAHTGDERRPSP